MTHARHRSVSEVLATQYDLDNEATQAVETATRMVAETMDANQVALAMIEATGRLDDLKANAEEQPQSYGRSYAVAVQVCLTLNQVYREMF